MLLALDHTIAFGIKEALAWIPSTHCKLERGIGHVGSLEHQTGRHCNVAKCKQKRIKNNDHIFKFAN